MTGRQWSWGVDLSTGIRSPSALGALPRRPDGLAVALARRLGDKDEAPPFAGPQFRHLAYASQGVRES